MRRGRRAWRQSRPQVYWRRQLDSPVPRPRGTSRRSGGGCSCCSGCSGTNRRGPGRRQHVLGAVGEAERGLPEARARRTASCAIRAEREHHGACGSPSSSLAQEGVAGARSRPASGLLPGGTHLTALVMRQPVQLEAVVARRRDRRARPAEGVQRLVEQHAGVVAGERPAGGVRAVEAGREADDQQPRRARRRTAPPARSGSPGCRALPSSRNAARRGQRRQAGSNSVIHVADDGCAEPAVPTRSRPARVPRFPA